MYTEIFDNIFNKHDLFNVYTDDIIRNTKNTKNNVLNIR